MSNRRFLIGMGVAIAAWCGVAAGASAVPLTYNIIVGQSNVGIRAEVIGGIDVTPDLTELLPPGPGQNAFPVTALMSGNSNTTPTGQSTVIADVGLPDDFNNGASGITFDTLKIVTANAPGQISGFGVVPPILLPTPLPSIQAVAFTATMSDFRIELNSPLSSSLTPSGNVDEWLWAGLADVTLSGTLRPLVEIPGQDDVTLGDFPFSQQVFLPLAGTFSAIPTGTEVTVLIPNDTLQNQSLGLDPISEDIDLLGLGLVMGTFELQDLVLADLTTAVVYRNATPIPEPHTAGLLGLGLVGLAVRRRMQAR